MSVVAIKPSGSRWEVMADKVMAAALAATTVEMNIHHLAVSERLR